jgi:hypothetical protein
MNPFPKDWELIGLFECEPDCLDADIPWFYNSLTFKTNRANDELTCIIEPADEVLKISWQRNARKIVDLDLHWISGLEIVMAHPNESLIVQFRDKNLLPLVLQLKPYINLCWGTNVDPMK